MCQKLLGTHGKRDNNVGKHAEFTGLARVLDRPKSCHNCRFRVCKGGRAPCRVCGLPCDAVAAGPTHATHREGSAAGRRARAFTHHSPACQPQPDLPRPGGYAAPPPVRPRAYTMTYTPHYPICH